MTLFPINEVRGRHIAEQKPVPLSQTDIVPIEMAMTLYEGELHGAEMLMIAGAPTYRLTGAGEDLFIDAQNGRAVQGPDEAAVRREALAAYKGEGTVSAMKLLSKAPREYGGAMPAWQVEFDDRQKTRLYFRADTARLTAVRTRLWRAFDLAWKFHIMNPKGDDFSTWWLSLASGLAALFALSGLGLLWNRFTGRRRLRRGAARNVS